MHIDVYMSIHLRRSLHTYTHRHVGMYTPEEVDIHIHTDMYICTHLRRSIGTVGAFTAISLHM